MNHKKNKGFTLIELMVVISIIGLLSSIVLASLSEAKSKANDAKIMAEFNQLRIALELYRNENGYYPGQKYQLYETSGIFCISTISSDCSIAGVTISTPTLNDQMQGSSRPLLKYKPSKMSSVDGNKGFVYQYTVQPTTLLPQIIFATSKTGVVNAQVGTWTLSSGSNQ